MFGARFRRSMKKNSVFSEYMRISKESGLMSKTPIKKLAFSEEGRKSSMIFSDIEALYGVKPKGVDEKEEIIEVAHPETCIIAPAYDAQNGMIENLWQRQSIMTDIALKTPDGSLINRRYIEASQDVAEDLVKIGFSMDYEGQEDLMKLADSCSERLVKEAGAPIIGAAGIVGIVAGVAAAAGLAYLAYKPISVQNVKANAVQVLQALSRQNDIPYAPEMIREISRILPIIDRYNSVANAADGISANPDSAKDLTKGHVADALDNQVATAEQYKTAIQELAGKIPTWNNQIDASIRMLDRSEVKSDWWSTLSEIGNSIPSWMTAGTFDRAYGTNLKDALQALQGAITESLGEIPKVIQELQEHNSNIKAEEQTPTQALTGA